MLKSLQTLSLVVNASLLHGSGDKSFAAGRNVFMKKIIVHSKSHGNKVVQIDDEDFALVNNFNWWIMKSGDVYYACAYSSYKMVNGKPKTNNIRMHRLIMGVSDRTIFIDHKDRNGLNNQKNNLRIATISQNLANRRSFKGSWSKYKGVSYSEKKTGNKTHRYIVATIKVNKKLIKLGSFNTEKQAAIAYNEAALKYHGEFAYLNKIEKRLD